jgi:hypothetical protein
MVAHIANTELIDGLARIRRMRWLSHFPLFFLLVVAVLETILRSFLPTVGEPIWQSAIFQTAWKLLWIAAVMAFFLGFVVRAMKCPRCKLPYHYNYDAYRAKKLSWRVNEFSRECLHCGLRLDGSNV